MVDKPSHNGQREFVETALPRVFRMVEQAEYGAADNSNGPGGHRSRSEKQIVRIHIRIRKKEQCAGLSLCHTQCGRGKSGQQRAPCRLTAWRQQCFVTGTETSRRKAGETTTPRVASSCKPTFEGCSSDVGG